LPFPDLSDSSIAFEEYPYFFSSPRAYTWMFAIFLLKQSALELLRPQELVLTKELFDIFALASTELALKRAPAVSKMLKGRS